MNLRVVVAAAGSAYGGGLWLLDDDDVTRFTISINGARSTKQQIEAIQFAIAASFSEIGIEVPDLISTG
jgi:hypothetical protein